MDRCGAESGWDTKCILPVGDHYSHFDVEDRNWPNEEVRRCYQDSSVKSLTRARAIAGRTNRLCTAETVKTPASRKTKLADFFRANKGTWIDATTLLSPALGGSNGLSLLQELRADGYDIQVRRSATATATVFQYCFVGRSE